MTHKDIIDAYCKIRSIDHTIPDDVLDFMKDSAIRRIERINRARITQENHESFSEANDRELKEDFLKYNR